MHLPAHDPVRDVTLLMMVRFMPEDDFIRLCDRILPVANTTDGLAPTDLSCPILTFPDRSSDGPSCERCGCCDEPVEDIRETAAFAQATGLRACKGCIDATLAALFGPDDEAARIARHAFGLMASAHAA